MDGELGGLDVELLADVFADFHQLAAAPAAGAGLGLVAVLDARQVGGQRLPPGAGAGAGAGAGLAGGFGVEGVAGLLQLRLEGGQVGGDGLLEQLALAGGGQRLAPLAEAHALVVGEFEGQGLDFDFGGVQGLLGPGQFGLEPVEFGEGAFRGQDRRAQQGGNGVQRHRPGRRIHGVIIPWIRP